MSDLEKLDQVEGFVSKWVAWAKQNTMLAGFIMMGVPAILGAGYTGITKFNEVKEMYAVSYTHLTLPTKRIV